jgi:single-stranded DNA-binding protein
MSRKIIISPESLGNIKFYTGKVISDPSYNEAKTVLRFRLATNLLGIIDAVIYGPRKDGKTLPIAPEDVATIVKGANLKFNGRWDINPTEKDGKKYLNEHVVLTSWIPYEVPVGEFSGKVFWTKDAQGPKVSQAGERKAFSFQIARYRGKDANGNYNPSHFIDVVFFGNELPEFVKAGENIKVTGLLASDPRTVEVTGENGEKKTVTYQNRRLVAWKIEKNLPIEVEVDDEGNTISSRPVSAQTEEDMPANDYQPVEEPQDNMVF